MRDMAPMRHPIPYILPTFIEFKLNYYSRDAITYLAMPRDAEFGTLGKAPSSDGHDLWLVVDMHSSRKFADLDRDARLQPVELPGSSPKRVRLFRLAPN